MRLMTRMTLVKPGAVFIVLATITLSNVQASLRHIQINDPMPAFTLKDQQGSDIAYQHGQSQVWLFAFIAPDQSQTQKALEAIANLLKQVRAKGKALKLVAISTKDISTEANQSLRCSIEQKFPILLDKDYELWGKLGVIVTPTFLVVDQSDQVSWLKSGSGYDFEPELKTALWELFGLVEKKQAAQEEKVHALKNDTELAKMRRHLKMAKLLEKKNRIDAAIEEMRKAQALVPDSIETKIELGQLLCRNGQSQEALELVEKIDPNDHVENAAKKFIAGWAYHQLGDLDQAEKLLSEATVLNPKSARVLYELGKVCRAKGKMEKALDAFQLALADIFGEPKPTKSIQD